MLKPLDLLQLAVTALSGMALAWQGWNQTLITPDYLPYIDGAEQLLHSGILPKAGHLSSLASYFPPGGAYWFLPGLLWFSDLRLYEAPAMALCFVGSVTLLFVVTRRAFGIQSARLATAAFGLSAVGLRYWDGFALGHFYTPIFYLAVTWSLVRWVVDRRHWGVALALGLASLAVYTQHPVHALAVASVPWLWAAYRPPMSVMPLVAVAVFSLVIWAPYLAFEWPRRFVDVRSQLLGTSIPPEEL